VTDCLLALLKGPPTLVLIGFFVLALAYGVVVPPFENLDEIEHFEVVRYIAEKGRLAVHGTTEAENYHYRQEVSQPPLYHLLSAALVRLLQLETDDTAVAWRLNPWVACGPGAASLYDNRAVLYHNPHQESFPWRGALLTLHVLRLWSTLLQAITVLGAYALARLVSRRRHVGLVAMAVVAFNPQFLLVASGVNNDNLLTPLVTLSLCLILRTWQDGLSPGRTVGLGVLIGLAGLSKLSGWFLLPLFFLVASVRLDRSSASSRPAWLTIDHWKPVVTHGVLVVSIALALSGWWFWRNWQLYGDPSALQPMLEWVGSRDGSIYQSFLELGTMFRSFWGQIPCAFYPPGFYIFYTILTLAAISGLLLQWRRLKSTERGSVAILALWFLLILGAWMRWNAMTAAPGGRLLFPALAAIGLLMAIGITYLTRKASTRWGAYPVIVLLALLACWTGTRILPGFFAPPTHHDRASMPQPQRVFEASIAGKIALLGYDVSVNEQDDSLDLTLYWQALTSMTEDYVLTIQLVSARPADNTLRLNYNSWPGRGNYPTSAWQAREVIVDSYTLRLPEANLYTQAWDLHLAFYEGTSGERLTIEPEEGSVADHVVLERLRIAGDFPTCPENGALRSKVLFGEEVMLTHISTKSTNEETNVHLCWKVLKTLAADDYTIFVHLEDASGAQIATGDGPPMEGAFPTSMWQPGDVILDVRSLPAALPSQGGRITVGLYHANDGSRLPASIDGEVIPDAAVPIWPTRP